MKIKKIINNNIISAKDEKNQEVILMGRGIGFGRKKGESIDLSRIEKIFKRESDKEFSRFKEILMHTPIEQVDVADNVVRYAKRILNNSLDKDIYLSMTQFINNYVDKEFTGLPEISYDAKVMNQYFKVEYMIGAFAQEEMFQILGIRTTEKFASYIALFVVSAEYGGSLEMALQMVDLISHILGIIERCFPGEVHYEGVRYESCVAHLRYIASFVINREQKNHQLTNKDFLESQYRREYGCGKEIREYIKKTYDFELSDEEELYLLIHIRLITM